MDRFTRTADIIKAYYSYKQTADSATFVKKVCSFFDFIKDESLSDADLNLLLFLANEAGIPQYYDLLKSKFTKVFNCAGFPCTGFPCLGYNAFLRQFEKC